MSNYNLWDIRSQHSNNISKRKRRGGYLKKITGLQDSYSQDRQK
jgi:hypothetical protein